MIGKSGEVNPVIAAEHCPISQLVITRLTEVLKLKLQQSLPVLRPVDFAMLDKTMKLQGCGTALITPFREDQTIDQERLGQLVEWQIKSGIHFLVACGTTGETPTLSKEEWLRVIDITVEVLPDEYPWLPGRLPMTLRMPYRRPAS